MTTACTVSGMIAVGDAVCVSGWQPGPPAQPIVKRATAVNLAASKTVFGVAATNPVLGVVQVLVAGEVADNNITSLGPGGSRVIVTDITQVNDSQQCRLKRIDDTDGDTLPARQERFVVGTCDEDGNLVIQPRHSSDETGFPRVYNLLAYGAATNFNQTGALNDGTENLRAFRRALAAMKADGNIGAKLVANGVFFFAETLVIEQSVIIEGTGNGEPTPLGGVPDRSDPGTMFVFPANTTGIRIHSTMVDDDGPGQGGFHSGEKTVLRELTLYCKDPIDPVTNRTGHGVHATAPFFLQDVVIENFAGCGVEGVGAFITKTDGNVDGSVLINVKVGGCGIDGFRLRGADATGIVLLGCEADGCRRYGFFDQSKANTYLGCIAQNNAAEGAVTPPGGPPLEDPIGADFGSNYHTEGSAPASSAYSTSTFVGCYSEGNTAGRENLFFGSPTIIGGTLGASEIHPASTCFVLDHGVASQAPVVYSNDRARNDKPGAEKTLIVQFSVGTQNGNAAEAFQWQTQEWDPATLPPPAIPPEPPAPWPAPSFSDNSTLFYTDDPAVRGDGKLEGVAHRWWTLQNASYYRQVMRFPTVGANARHPAPWFTNGLFIGRDDTVTPLPLHFTAAPWPLLADGITPSPPPYQYAGLSNPQTYELGDVVWNSTPLAPNGVTGGPLGQVCTGRGTLGNFNNGAGGATGATTANSTRLTFDRPVVGVSSGQYITIAGEAVVFRIVSDLDPADNSVQLDQMAAGAGPLAAVDCHPPTFALFGRVEGSTISPINNYTATAGEHVVVSVQTNNVNLPSSPKPDDEVQVLNMSGGNITVTSPADPIYTIAGPAPYVDTRADDTSTAYRWVAGGINMWKRL